MAMPFDYRSVKLIPSANNALKFALAVWERAFEEAKAHSSANRAGI